MSRLLEFSGDECDRFFARVMQHDARLHFRADVVLSCQRLQYISHAQTTFQWLAPVCIFPCGRQLLTEPHGALHEVFDSGLDGNGAHGGYVIKDRDNISRLPVACVRESRLQRLHLLRDGTAGSVRFVVADELFDLAMQNVEQPTGDIAVAPRGVLPSFVQCAPLFGIRLWTLYTDGGASGRSDERTFPCAFWSAFNFQSDLPGLQSIFAQTFDQTRLKGMFTLFDWWHHRQVNDLSRLK